MKITTATFVQGATIDRPFAQDGLPQVAFIGRSNVGKSSVINSVTHHEGLAKTSSFPGRTQQLNFFLFNKTVYGVDLPGYGFADISEIGRKRLQELIDWYLFSGEYEQAKIVFIIDAAVGFTEMDLEMLHALEEHHKPFVIVANKIDKIKPSEFDKKIEIIKELSGSHRVILYSATTGVGIGELAREIMESSTGRGATKKTQIFGGPRVVRGVKSRPRASRAGRHEE